MVAPAVPCAVLRIVHLGAGMVIPPLVGRLFLALGPVVPPIASAMAAPTVRLAVPVLAALPTAFSLAAPAVQVAVPAPVAPGLLGLAILAARRPPLVSMALLPLCFIVPSRPAAALVASRLAVIPPLLHLRLLLLLSLQLLLLLLLLLLQLLPLQPLLLQLLLLQLQLLLLPLQLLQLLQPQLLLLLHLCHYLRRHTDQVGHRHLRWGGDAVGPAVHEVKFDLRRVGVVAKAA
mmetsp:Transcript_49444/g.141300  ORF Transcript_49444/g.141300 Transcript_49444/m.141300 type:complete len:233 (-) Transcript_49444:179-877(-)